MQPTYATRRRIASATGVAILFTLAGLVAAAPPAVAQEPTYSQQGIQFGDPVNLDNCQIMPAVQEFLTGPDAAALQAHTNWVRLDLRGAGAGLPGGCDVRPGYRAILDALPDDIQVVGLLTYDFLLDDDLADWRTDGAAFEAVARRFADAAALAVCDYPEVDVWEIWNEPNLDLYELTPNQFARLLVLTVPAMREAGCLSPGTELTIISGGLNSASYPVSNPFNPDEPCNADCYLRLVHQRLGNDGDPDSTGLHDLVDGVGVHPYVGTFPDNSTVDHPEVKRFMDAFLWVGLPLYVTEYSWPIGGAVTPELACENIDRAMFRLWQYGAARVPAAIYYALWDGPGEARGLYAGPGQPRPGLDRYLGMSCPETPETGWYDAGTQTVHWSPVAGATSYEVALGPTAGGTLTIKRTVGATQLALGSLNLELGATVPYTWKVTSLKNGKRYGSKLFSFTTTTRPSPPTNVTAFGASTTNIEVRWTDNATNETAYQIQTNGTTWTLTPNTTRVHFGGMAPGTTMCFTVRALNSAGASAWSNQVCGTTLTGTVPPAPTGVTATPTGSTSIKINWIDNATDEIRYEIGNGTSVISVGANTTVYTWPNMAPGEYRCFQVRAVNATGPSAWSQPSCATTHAPPIGPTIGVVTAMNSTSITVTWVDNSLTETGFQISNGTTTASIGPNQSLYTWGGLAPGTNMCFQVRAVNAYGASPWSAWGCATTPTALPAAPTNLTAVPVSGTTIRVAWTDNSSNESWFQVWNGTNDSYFPANATSATFGSLAPGTTRCFRVRAGNGAGTSAWTPTVCATTP